MKLVPPVLWLLCAGIACAETNSALLEQVHDVMKAELKAAQNSNDPIATRKANNLQALLFQNADIGFGHSDPTLNLIRNVEAIEVVATSDKLEDLCRTLLKQLREERVQQATALRDEMEKAFPDALQASLSAKTATDIDAPMKAVAQLTGQARYEYSEDSKLRMLQEQGQALELFLRELQNCLSETERPNSNSANSRMMEVVRFTGDLCTLMPRSEILTRLATMEDRRHEKAAPAKPEAPAVSPERLGEEARQAVIATQTPAQIRDTLRKLESFTAQLNGAHDDYLVGFIHNLRDLQKIQLDLENGLATDFPLPLSGNATEEGEAITNLRMQLLLQATPRVLGLEKSVPVQSGDNLATYLNRAAARARAKSDWALVSRIIDFAQTVNIGTAFSTIDRSALQSFHAGLNQEQARQHALAVVSFETALRAGSPLDFAGTIGNHLDTIRKEHPQEYEEGLQIFRTPPAPVMPWTAGARGPSTPGGLPAPPSSIAVPAAPSPDATSHTDK